MSGFVFKETELKGSFLIDNFSSGDSRGRFTKCFEKSVYANGGINFSLNETFASVSSKNVIRGLHFQTHAPQAKLVCVLCGRVWDVMVDLRKDSETYGKWTAAELSAENHRAFYVPRGFAHGFASLEDNTVMLYQCDGAYDNASDTGIVFTDTDIGIPWPVDVEKAIVSDRDRALMSFKEFDGMNRF